MGKNTRSRHWILTNNYKETEPIEDNQLMEHIKSINGLVFTVFQLERGEQGTLHHQIYLSFKNADRFSKIKDAFPTAHIEPAKGTPQQVYDYCTKEDTRVSPPHEWGELPQQGKRNDFKEIIELIELGVPNYEIRQLYPSQYIRYGTRINEIRNEILSEKFDKQPRFLEVIYLCDLPGSGKTRYIMEKYGYENVYRVSNYKHPFDSYHGQDVIVFEEFRSNLPIEQMLNYLDIYPLKLPARYSDKTACFTKVYIVSNWTLFQQYENVQQQYPSTWQALMRRIHFNGNLEQVKRYEECGDIF